MKVRFTEASRADFREIGDYIAKGDRPRAQSFTRELRAAASRIGQMPLGYPVVSHLKGRSIRRKPHAGYLIFYVVMERTIDIIRILHGARDYEAVIATPQDDEEP